MAPFTFGAQGPAYCDFAPDLCSGNDVCNRQAFFDSRLTGVVSDGSQHWGTSPLPHIGRESKPPFLSVLWVLVLAPAGSS